MGRRALGKVDRSLDLSRHHFPLEFWDAERPIVDVFETERPVEIEIGSGKGLFLRNIAAAHPERNFLGVELARKYARYAAAMLATAELPNAVMVQGDGQQMLRDLVADNSILAIHVYFPDPWWKTRHRKRRLMNETFVRRIERVLQPGGRLHFWTDVEAYFQATLRVLAEATTLDGPHEVPEKQPEHEMDYRTHFERRMRRHGKPIHRCEFVKRA